MLVNREQWRISLTPHNHTMQILTKFRQWVNYSKKKFCDLLKEQIYKAYNIVTRVRLKKNDLKMKIMSNDTI